MVGDKYIGKISNNIYTILYEDEHGALLEWNGGKHRSWIGKESLKYSYLEYKEPVIVHRYARASTTIGFVTSWHEFPLSGRHNIKAIFTDGELTSVEVIK